MFLPNSLSKKDIVNFLIYLIPLSYIGGNLILNFNVVFLISFVFLAYRFEVFKYGLNNFDKIVIIFFGYLLINGIFNNFFNFNYPDAPKQNIVLIKSILFLRFLFLYLIIKFLILEKMINFKHLFFIFGACSLLVSFDLSVQFFLGKNLIGFEGGGRRLSGLFGDEYIAGSYVQRFFIFLIFFIFIYQITDNKKLTYNFSLFLIIIINLFGILFSGNRIPLILSLVLLSLLFFYEKSLRKVLIILFVLFVSGVAYFINTNRDILNHYNSFKNRSIQTIEYIIKRATTNEILSSNTYIKEIESGVLTWNENFYFGGGIKSFFWNCNNIDRDKMLKFVTPKGKVNCNTHPHNYYLEVGAELGVVGFLIIVLLFLMIIFKSIIYYLSNVSSKNKHILYPFLILFFVEVFPLKTTGSFFTTTNATFLFIIMSFTVGLLEVKDLQKK